VPTEIKKRDQLTLADRLSRLSYRQACKLLGPQGEKLLLRGGKHEIDLDSELDLSGQSLSLRMSEATVIVELDGRAARQLRTSCSVCTVACEHQGAALSLILEEKMTLGLAAPPPASVPVESLGEEELVQQAIAERMARGRDEKMRLRSTSPSKLWTDYVVTSAGSGKAYRVALRGWRRGESYCSCPDFRKNTLGTCKHVEHVMIKVKRRFPAAVRGRPYRRRELSLYVRYGEQAELLLGLPQKLQPTLEKIVAPLRGRAASDVSDLIRRLRRLERAGHGVTIYPDAERLLEQCLFRQRIESRVAEIRRDPAAHPLRHELLNAELLPYQLDGIAFAAGAGRAILADDMGLGKTIQGLGVAELLAREAGISRVLVICPASLKSQWRSEIRRFSGRGCQVVLGAAAERPRQYDSGAFFTVCNYEQVLRDLTAIERVAWDLIVLDEGQRIKNWETKTARAVKGLRSPFALVLSGTPMATSTGTKAVVPMTR